MPGWRRTAAVLLVAAIAAILYRPRGSSIPRAHPLPAAATIPEAPRLPRVARTEPVSPGPRAAAQDPAAAPGTLEICGFGRFKLDDGDPSALGARVRQLTRSARQRWIAAMLDSDDLRARAAGLLLQSRWTEDNSPATLADQDRYALVQLAVGATDPAVYATALYACGFDRDAVTDDACRPLSAAKWAALDPGNAMAWLLVARQARTAHDPGAEAAAFARAAGADRVDAYTGSLFSAAQAELPNDVTDLERAAFAQQVFGVSAAVGLSQYAEISQRCSRASMQNDEVRDQCGALAEVLVAKSNTLLDFGLGARIGERAGWPRERVDALLERRDALLQVGEQAHEPTAAGPLSCESVRAENAFVEQRNRLGELGALGALVPQSGQSVAELAQRFRDRMDAMRRDSLQRAASAAAAASAAPPP